MSAGTIDLKIRINFPLILFITLASHALLLTYKYFPGTPKYMVNETRKPLRIVDIQDFRKIRTVGARDSKVKDSAYLAKSQMNSKTISAQKFAPTLSKKAISLTDLSVSKPVRPGTMPEKPKAITVLKPKALAAVKLKGREMSDYIKSDNVTAKEMSGDPRTSTLNNSDIMVNLEVPEGVNPDELNEYELVFYGFQRRTAIGYINSFYKNLDKFQRANPHLQFPMTSAKQVMTGRLTYDEQGNIKQIKMIRWSNENKLQDFFEQVLKEMDTLHNPPKMLWSKSGEFSIFFSLVLNG